MLALFGFIPWRAVPVMPVEIMLLPKWFPFHLDKISYWSRTVIVPLLVLALVMAAALGPALDNTIVAIAIPLIPYTARVVRSNTLTLREQPFVEAARAV